MTIVSDVLAGKRLALARLLTRIENNLPEGREALNFLFPYTGRAHLIGITGSPGAGKSSLVNRLALYYRQLPEDQRKTVAVIAVDPSSPFTGGAILGDRVRMRDLAGDAGVFIRSMASRGILGGLAAATAGLVQAFDAAGYEVILVETVGAGQAEVDIARLAHTTLVIEAPGLGDDIQAIKAGILEIADILVVNKADRPGADITERALRSTLQMAHPGPHVFKNHSLHHSWSQEQVNEPHGSFEKEEISYWIPPIIKTVATEGDGIQELGVEIANHLAYLKQSGEFERRESARLQTELNTLLHQELEARWRSSISEDTYVHVVQQLVKRQISPYQAVKDLLDGGKK